jgi:hypothetical protein
MGKTKGKKGKEKQDKIPNAGPQNELSRIQGAVEVKMTTLPKKRCKTNSQEYQLTGGNDGDNDDAIALATNLINRSCSMPDKDKGNLPPIRPQTSSQDGQKSEKKPNRPRPKPIKK